MGEWLQGSSMTQIDPQIQPHDLELERNVIAHCLWQPDAMPSLFNSGPERLRTSTGLLTLGIDVIKHLTHRGVVPDLPTVGSELRSRGQMDEVGPAYYSRLVDGFAPPHRDNIPHIGGQA
jgi:hypothetical protein